MCQLHGFVHVALHAGVTLEVLVDVSRCGLGLNAQILGQTKAAHAVDQAKVDDLGIATLLARHVFHAHAKHFGGCGLVYVQPFAEGLEQRLIAPERWAMMRSSICE